MREGSGGRVTAVLGPTNTGKTYLAIERMLAHRSGMIGFPLRLLARENYERVAAVKGRRAVALVTGEEKIVPANPQYFLCTVESMPLDRPVAFLAVDEIQLCADPERGHVFTDRLLHARGEDETMFLGADTIRPIIRRLVPGAEFLSRPRFSTLTYTGAKKVTRLPPRSALIVFSAAEVYAVAELMRRHRGGTAVVLGALSPRTRNAQVAMFQAGEVDHMVATDAIGMGLNMDLDHVAFTRLVKFDGRGSRRLTAPEVAQIAGRAGRHMSDGTFGTTVDLGRLEPELVEAVEGHRFDPLSAVYWRNRELDFHSVHGLLRSLEAPPPRPEMIRVREADDHRALATLTRDPRIAAMALGPAAVRLLWDVCQIPDFRKTLTDSHIRLLGAIYRALADGSGRLGDDWVAAQVARIDRTDGEIDTLLSRIAHIRTWTYISHRADWLNDAGRWQDRTLAVEDKLSDALHDRLTQRFVDRRAALLVKRLRGGEDLLGGVAQDGTVTVEGHCVGRLAGLRFVPDAVPPESDPRPIMAAARRMLAQEIPQRIARLLKDSDDAFAVRPDGAVEWRGEPMARVVRGASVLSPAVEVAPAELVDGVQREQLRARLAGWLAAELGRRLGPLMAARDAVLAGAARGLVYQLCEALGTLPRDAVAAQIAGLGRADRRLLAALGVRLGRHGVWLDGLKGRRQIAMRALLWRVHAGEAPPPPRASARVLADAASYPAGYCQAIGFLRFEGRHRGTLRTVAVRADVLDRVAAEAWRLAQQGDFAVTPQLCRAAGCAEADLAALLSALGYRAVDGAEQPTFRDAGRRRPAAARAGRRGADRKASAARTESPFAALRGLKVQL
jgi:ATP-dependent RNA helicase SUPV3L1/SUV3